MKVLKIFFVLLLMTMFSATTALAVNERYAFNLIINGCVEEKTGTEFPAVIKNESENVCVGTGLRIQYIFIEVYAAAFYVDKNSVSALKNHKGDLAKEIAEGNYPRIIVMKFLMDVPANKLKERFLVGLKQTMPNPSPKTKNELNSFLDTLKDVKKGEEISIYFGYYVAGEMKKNLVATKNFVVDNKELSVGLLYLWFDNEPASPDLKKNILKNLGGR